MSGLFISQELREKRTEIRRNQDELIKISNELYEIIKEDLNKAQRKTGRDYITYTADRKIGKTYTLMKLAAEYDYPLIVHDAAWAGYVKKEAKKLFNKDIIVRSYRTIPYRFDGVRCDNKRLGDVVAKEFARKFYDSKLWKDCRKAYIAERMLIDGGVCEVCHKEPIYMVHHEVTLTPLNINNPEITLNHKRLKGECKGCHDKEDGHYNDNKKRIEPLCSFDSEGNPIDLRGIPPSKQMTDRI